MSRESVKGGGMKTKLKGDDRMYGKNMKKPIKVSSDKDGGETVIRRHRRMCLKRCQIQTPTLILKIQGIMEQCQHSQLITCLKSLIQMPDCSTD